MIRRLFDLRRRSEVWRVEIYPGYATTFVCQHSLHAMKKLLKKPVTKKSNTKSDKKPAATKQIKKAATKKKQAPKRAPTFASQSAIADRQAVVDLVDKISLLHQLLAKTCKYALDAADVIADERLVEAEEDHAFRDEIESIRVTAGISLPERAPKSKLDAAGEEYVWIADECDEEHVPVIPLAQYCDRHGTSVVAQQSDHEDGIPGHEGQPNVQVNVADEAPETEAAPSGDGSNPTMHLAEQADRSHRETTHAVPALEDPDHQPSAANGV